MRRRVKRPQAHPCDRADCSKTVVLSSAWLTDVGINGDEAVLVCTDRGILVAPPQAGEHTIEDEPRSRRSSRSSRTKRGGIVRARPDARSFKTVHIESYYGRGVHRDVFTNRRGAANGEVVPAENGVVQVCAGRNEMGK